jgi:hypothetical protein
MGDRLAVWRSEVERDAATDGVSARAAWTVFWAPLVGAVVVALTALWRPLFTFITDEDSILEWGQFVFYAAAAVLSFLVVPRLWRSGQRSAAILFLLLGLGLVFITGEEISWGQRIFGFGTPEELAEINNQDEFTLHNITDGFNVQKVFNYVQMVGGLALFLLPYLTRVPHPRWTSQLLRTISPALLLGPAFLLPGLYRFVRLFVVTSTATVPVKFGEWPELTTAFGLAAYTFLLWRTLGRARVAAGESAASR